MAEALAETCYRLGYRGRSPLEWSPTHLVEQLDETRMMEAYIKYKLILGMKGIQTKGTIHEALSKKRWERAPWTPKLWEEDELIKRERKIRTRPITFQIAQAEMGTTEWADVYNKMTKEHYTMGIHVKRLHRQQLQETEQGTLGIIWGRNKGEILETQEESQDNRRMKKVLGVMKKRQTAECRGGEKT
eukprot:6181786-Pleurochrysis_carterae.AAC.1